ncbi:MAG: hypothetical protein JGK34_10175 [Microcoleus sp. PH2017_26_ELK_O_A]|nr:hypothetical protein [Microcoleus sp. PH2017_26_ELK_O_A]
MTLTALVAVMPTIAFATKLPYLRSIQFQGRIQSIALSTALRATISSSVAISTTLSTVSTGTTFCWAEAVTTIFMAGGPAISLLARMQTKTCYLAAEVMITSTGMPATISFSVVKAMMWRSVAKTMT